MAAKPGQRLRTNSPPVIYETVAGETILVHLETGTYFDLNTTGGFVFESFAGGGTQESAVEAAAERFGAQAAEIEGEIEGFIAEATAEGLLVPDDGMGSPPPPSGEIPEDAPWEAPKLNRHTDMQELLMLDPVHEAKPGGWPARA